MYPTIKDCVRRAHLDLSRTVHGINQDGVAKTLRWTCHELVERLLREATLVSVPWSQESFDAWHREACARVTEHFCENGYATFFAGQAQKWINMAIKYALTLDAVGMLHVEHSSALRQVAHVPIDNFIVGALKRLGVKPIEGSWSRIAAYDAYMTYQQDVRSRFPGSALLDVEFHEWNEESQRRRNLSVPSA